MLPALISTLPRLTGLVALRRMVQDRALLPLETAGAPGRVQGLPVLEFVAVAGLQQLIEQRSVVAAHRVAA